MIETHVLNTGLAASWKSGWFYKALDFTNGYVAVAFAFCAGAGFWVLASRKPDLAAPFTPIFWKTLRRSGFLLLASYWWNTIPFSFAYVRHAGAEDLRKIAQCDILHAIAFSQIVALVLLLTLRRPERLRWACCLAALAIFLVTPLEWRWHAIDRLPVFFAMPLESLPPSKFPLFPWMGYVLAGVGITGFLLTSKRPQMTAVLFGLAGFLAPFVAFHVKDRVFTYPGMGEAFPSDWFPSPGHSLFRLGGVVFVFSSLYLLEKWDLRGRIAWVFARNGQESLSMYFSHLVLVYGTLLTPSLETLAPGRLHPLEVVGLFVAITLLCSALAAGWHSFKEKNPRRATAVLAGLVAVALIFFFLAPAELSGKGFL